MKVISTFSHAISLVKALASIANPNHWGVFALAAKRTKFDHDFSVSWSQGGEDLALNSIFGNVKDGRYIDIGAHHPSRFSVTRHLYQQGWRGINIDANPHLIKTFQEQRSDEVNLNLAVGSKDSYKFDIFDEPAISTTNIEWRNKFLSEGNKVEQTVIIKGRSLNSILEEYFPNHGPELLTIDIEGSDYEALSSIDFPNLSFEKYPKWILLESSPPISHALNFPAVKHAMSYGYEPYMVLSMATLLKAPKFETVLNGGK
jgi:FkbM family methyltransferase